jgi:hypothetical protein
MLDDQEDDGRIALRRDRPVGTYEGFEVLTAVVMKYSIFV